MVAHLYAVQEGACRHRQPPRAELLAKGRERSFVRALAVYFPTLRF